MGCRKCSITYGVLAAPSTLAPGALSAEGAICTCCTNALMAQLMENVKATGNLPFLSIGARLVGTGGRGVIIIIVRLTVAS